MEFGSSGQAMSAVDRWGGAAGGEAIRPGLGRSALCARAKTDLQLDAGSRSFDAAVALSSLPGP
jgi:hypothetical protein